MKVSKEELLHIAKLSDLKLSESEQESYLKNLDDILEYTNVLNSVPISDLDETIGANDNENVFRKDEVKQFNDTEIILKNAPELERNMYKIPKVIG